MNRHLMIKTFARLRKKVKRKTRRIVNKLKKDHLGTQRPSRGPILTMINILEPSKRLKQNNHY